MFGLSFSIKKTTVQEIQKFFATNMTVLLIVTLASISWMSFIFYYSNHLGIAYNDARSHLDIARRVVEGLKPGFAQLGSVWLPLPHLLMVPTVWNDFMWHSGLAGALPSMLCFVFTGVIIYKFLFQLGVNVIGRILGLFVFVANINILYMQSTSMTELLLILTMTAAVYEFYMWHKKGKMFSFIAASFWVMLSTLVRYDGWFLFLYIGGVLFLYILKSRGYKAAEGLFLFFITLAGFGIVLWFLWNLLIFKDPLYFALGPYSAHAQQEQLAQAGVLATKGNMLLSLNVYLYALAYNSGAITLFVALFGAIVFFIDKKIPVHMRIAASALFVPLFFNVLALYLGHSVLFVQGISGDTWFNVRYGLMMLPGIAIFIGYLSGRINGYKYVLIGIIVFLTIFAFQTGDAVTIDDARVGSSQKNVSEVSGWLNQNAKDKDGFILISAASHDAIIFSSGLPMSKFIHEGTGAYWIAATTSPDRWARWIVMRTHDNNDQTFKLIGKNPAMQDYTLVAKYPFADVYEMKPEYVSQLHTKPVLGKQR